MKPRARMIGFAVAGAGFAALLFWALVGLPDFGHYHWPYGNALNKVALPERHATNTVGITVFDYRGFDTLGEEFILFAAVIGVSLLLRKDPEEHVPPDEVRSDPIRALGVLGVMLLFVLGLWVVAFGIVTPGGGFQGGVALAGAFLLVYLIGGYRQYHSLLPHSPLEMAEATGAGAFAVLGFVGIAYAGAYLGNFLGIGNAGSLYSGGSVPLLNWATGIEVCAALVVLFSEFLKIYMVPAASWTPERGPR
jgi:multicomponent Na+:H+ antiporter subunit B